MWKPNTKYVLQETLGGYAGVYGFITDERAYGGTIIIENKKYELGENILLKRFVFDAFEELKDKPKCAHLPEWF